MSIRTVSRVITALVKSSVTSHHEDRSSSRHGTTQRPARRTEPPCLLIRITSSACAVAPPDRPGPPARSAVSTGQLIERAGGQGGLQAPIELVSGQPAVPRGGAQHIHDSVPVCIRSPHPGRCTGSGRLTGRREICRHIPSPPLPLPFPLAAPHYAPVCTRRTNAISRDGIGQDAQTQRAGGQPYRGDASPVLPGEAE